MAFNANERYWYSFDYYKGDVPSLLRVKYLTIERSCGANSNKKSTRGKPFLTWDEFLEWYEVTESEFKMLYDNWVASGYTRKLSPSVDRIDATKGYIKNNLQWLTVSDNCKKNAHTDNPYRQEVKS
jgi:hypothetical protein